MKTNLNTLINIYNTLLDVETKGNSTFLMADSLKALKSLIVELQNAVNEMEEKNAEPVQS